MSKQFDIFTEIVKERDRQDLMWGEQNWPIKPHDREWTRDIKVSLDKARNLCDISTRNGSLTWNHIAYEEFLEIFAEDAPVKQREELIQSLAVQMAMVEYLDRRYPHKEE